jgi:hypothetical protein
MKNDSKFAFGVPLLDSVVCPLLIPGGWNLPRIKPYRALALIECNADAKAGAPRTRIRNSLNMNGL